MICPECGKELAEDIEFCDGCGADIKGPAVIKVTKDDLKKKKIEKREQKKNEGPRLKAEGPFLDLDGYGKSLTKNLSNLMALVGALAIYISPFLVWATKENYEGKYSSSLFDLAGKHGDFCLKHGILGVYAVGIILFATMLLILSAREYIRPLRPYADIIVLRIIPWILSVGLVVLIYTDKQFKLMADKKWVTLGIGPTILIAGLVLSAIAIFVNGTREENNG